MPDIFHFENGDWDYRFGDPPEENIPYDIYEKQERIKTTPEPVREREPQKPRLDEPLMDWPDDIMLVAGHALKRLRRGERTRNPMTHEYYHSKDWESMSRVTQEEYTRRINNLSRTLETLTDTDILCRVISSAHTRSRQTYYKHRTLARLWAVRNGRDSLVSLLDSLPEYMEVRRTLGDSPPERLTDEIQKRRTTPIGELAKLTAISCRMQLPSDKIAPVIAYLTGARLCELPTLAIYMEADNSIRVKIATRKQGCRKRNAKVPVRVIRVLPNTHAHKVLSAIIDKFGNKPLAELDITSFAKRWERARDIAVKAGITDAKRFNMHSLRHAFKTRLEKILSDKMTKEHGKSWHTDKHLKKQVEDIVRISMGHSCVRTTRDYGQKM